MSVSDVGIRVRLPPGLEQAVEDAVPDDALTAARIVVSPCRRERARERSRNASGHAR